MIRVELRIDEILKEKDKSLYWLWKKSGMSYANLSKLVKNENTLINFTTIERLCEALEVKPGDLFRYYEF